jgi:hypothetical protein
MPTPHSNFEQLIPIDTLVSAPPRRLTEDMGTLASSTSTSMHSENVTEI